VFAEQVDEAVVEAHFQRHLRVALRERGQRGHEQIAAEGHGHVHAQFALRPCARVAHLVVRGLQLGEDAPAPLEIDGAFRRNRNFSCGSMKQTCTEVLLELGNIARCHRAAHVHDVRGAGKGAQFGHLGEDPHSLELIHGAGL
jgi:hypothetical protein